MSSKSKLKKEPLEKDPPDTKSSEVPDQSPAKPEPEKPRKRIRPEGKPSPFLIEMAALMARRDPQYADQDRNLVTENLTPQEVELWLDRAYNALNALGKLNKEVTDAKGKKTPKDVHVARTQRVGFMQNKLGTFIEGVKTLQCPQCRTKSNLKKNLFPTQELAHQIVTWMEECQS